MYVFSKFLMLLHAFDVSLNSTNFINFFSYTKAYVSKDFCLIDVYN